MHFEILTEDISGQDMLEILLPELLGECTYRIRPYEGIGSIPKNMNGTIDAKKTALLNDLPRILNGYGQTFSGYPEDYLACVVVVCDLDRRCLSEFLSELNSLLENCAHRPLTQFCIAVEEGEAWLLGDIDAILTAYPKAKRQTLNRYVQDSICGTWEFLADAIGENQGKVSKREWANRIAPYMQIQRNRSPSFQYFVNRLNMLKEIERTI